jgi:hypothetical protein
MSERRPGEIAQSDDRRNERAGQTDPQVLCHRWFLALCGQRVMSPQRPAPAARDADEMVVPCRIGVVIASRMLAAGASATVRLGRRTHPAGSPCQATPGTRPVVDTRIDTRHLDRRNGFEPATRRTSGNNHTASGFGRAGGRLRTGKERCGHSASHGWLSTEALLVRPAAAGRAQGKAKTTHCITKTTKEAVCFSGATMSRAIWFAARAPKTSRHVSTVVVPRVHGYRNTVRSTCGGGPEVTRNLAILPGVPTSEGPFSACPVRPSSKDPSSCFRG